MTFLLFYGAHVSPGHARRGADTDGRPTLTDGRTRETDAQTRRDTERRHSDGWPLHPTVLTVPLWTPGIVGPACAAPQRHHSTPSPLPLPAFHPNSCALRMSCKKGKTICGKWKRGSWCNKKMVELKSNKLLVTITAS